MKRPPSKASAGFTLIEVMLAAAVLLAGIVGGIQVIMSGSAMLETSRKQAVALEIIHSELDRVRVQDWSVLANGSNVAVDLASRYPAASYPAFQTALGSSSFACTRTIADVSGKSNYKSVEFTVTWKNHNGTSSTRSGSTYVGKNGLYVSYQK